nr:hypothetical protein [Tanacetum cinerariifolium]
MANDDPILTIMRFIPHLEAIQKYDAILPDTLTNQAMKESEAYKTSYGLATRKVIPKPKYKSSDDEDDDEVSMSKDNDDDAESDDGQDVDNEQTELDNHGDDFVHPKFSTHDEEVRQDKKDKDEEGSDLWVHTPSHYVSDDYEAYDDFKKGWKGSGSNFGAVAGEAFVTPTVQQQSSSVSSGLISNMLNPNPDTSIDSILNLNTELTFLVDVPVTFYAEMPLSSATTPLPPPIPLIQSLVKALKDDFSEFKQTNLFAETVSLIPGIVNAYLANKMNEAVKTAVQLQSNILRDEAQAKNEDFINKLVENIKKIIKEQVKEKVSKIFPSIKKLVNDQLEYEVLTHSSNEAKIYHVIAANLSKLKLKKILIDKMESNKSIHQSIQQKTLYKALIDAYETHKVILDTYGDTVMIKRH